MVNIEEELKMFLYQNIKENDQKSRDIELILFFFGFDEELWPTLEDAAIKFNVGESEKRRSERPRQIIQKKFTNKANISMLPRVTEVVRIFEKHTYCSLEIIEDALNAQGLLPKSYSIKGVLNLLQQLGLCNNFNIYTNKLTSASRTSIGVENQLYLLLNDELKVLRSAFKKLKVYPGLVGIAKWGSFFEKNQEYDNYKEILLDVMRSRDDVWLKVIDDELFYTVENRDNTLVNNLEKIRNIAASVDLKILSVVLGNAFKARTAPKGNSYPSIKVIEQYLKKSRYTVFDGSTLKLKVEPSPLRDIERDVVNIMKGKDQIDFVEVKQYLESKGYSKPSIDKAILNSTIVHADKSLRKSYKYKLISNSEFKDNENITRYSLFKDKLMAACVNGTDAEIESFRRKEQQILRQWLFEGKEIESCALCQNDFHVSSLVTAHKKKRAKCSFNERTDPNIVMPLCKFGCDHLYELEVLKVQNNIITFNDDDNVAHTAFERAHIDMVVNKTVETKWLVGEADYFKK